MSQNLSNDDDPELNLDHFKEMIRNTANEQNDSLNRSQDFVGTMSPRGSRKSPGHTKIKAGCVHSDDRPDDWLGSPGSAKRKSYKVKAQSLPLGVAPPLLHQEKGHSNQFPTSTSMSPSKTPIYGSGKPPSGLTRHTLGASSSHHQSPYATSSLESSGTHTANDLSPDPEKYKAMMRTSMHEEQEMNRSQEFLGEQDSIHGESPKRHSTHTGSPSGHKWGAPSSPEQYRPDDWLGSPSSARRKSYKVRSPGASPVPNLDSDTDGDKDKDSLIPAISRKYGTPIAGKPNVVPSTSTSSLPTHTPLDERSKSSRPRGSPVKTQSLAIGAIAPKLSPKVATTTTRGSGRPVSRPGKSQSLGLGQRSPWDGAGNERVDREKFVQAFSAFEGSDINAPVPSLFASSSPVPPSPHQPMIIGSPTGTRNFRISKEARAKNDLLQQGSGHSLNSSTHTPRPRRNLNSLNSAIANLRKVAIRKSVTKGDRSEQQASEIIQLLKHLKHNRLETDAEDGTRAIVTIVNTLRREGVIETHMEVDELKDIHGSIVENIEGVFQRLDYHEPQRMELEVCTRILNQLGANNSRSAGVIEDVVGRLKKVSPTLSSNLDTKLNESIAKLEAISWKVGQREMDELANVIRNLDHDDFDNDDSSNPQFDNLTLVLGALDHSLCDLSGRDTSFMSNEPQTSLDPSLSPRGRDPAISPRSEAPRNFVVSEEAKRKNLKVLDLSNHSDQSEPMEELLQVMSRLRKVVVTPKTYADKSEQQASELMQIVKHLRQTGVNDDAGAKELFDLFEDLKKREVISSNLGPNRMEEVRKAVAQLDGIRKQSDYSAPCKNEIEKVIQQHLRKLTPTSAGAPDIIQQAIARLRKVVPALRQAEQEGTEDVVQRLQAVLMSMQEGQEAQLAQAIRNLESAQGSDVDMGNLQQIVDKLDKVQGRDEHQERAKRAAEELASEDDEKVKESSRRAKARLSPEDADYLVYALMKLKRANMDKVEAAAVAGFIRNLKPVQSSDDEEASDVLLRNLTKTFDSKKKARAVEKILKGLRRLNLNDPERADLAEIVRGLGKGKGMKYRDDIADAIGKLRNVKMTRPEAKEAAGIMFNLRKAKRDGFDIDNSREMINLRKVMRAEKADVISSVFKELGNSDLTEKEIDEFAGLVADMGCDELDPNEFQLITIEYIDGVAYMVLNIPDGDDYADRLDELVISEHFKKKKTYETRAFRFWIELDPEDGDSDHLLHAGDSDFEEESDDEGNNMTPKTRERLTITMKAKKRNSIVPPLRSPKPPPKSPKKLHHYGKAQDTDIQSPLTEEKEKKIRFTNKHHWRFKKHNTTVVSEKRWRFEEDFNADEVIWSPLSRDQYDRRKTVGASILATMDKFAPLDDMLLDEFEEDKKGSK